MSRNSAVLVDHRSTRGTARHMIATAVSLLAVVAIGCNSDDGKDVHACTASLVYGLTVQVENATEGGECPKVTATEGSYSEELESRTDTGECSEGEPNCGCFDKDPSYVGFRCVIDGSACSYVGAAEREGTYEVTVQQDGHAVASQTVTVPTDADGCHPENQQLTFEL